MVRLCDEWTNIDADRKLTKLCDMSPYELEEKRKQYYKRHIEAGVKCAEGMVCIAIFALAMVFTLPAALRQQKLTMWFGGGACRTFTAPQRYVEAQGSLEPELANSCVSQIRLDARRPLD